MDEEQTRIRKVNQSLGDAPSIGPLPGNQLIPWFLLASIAWFIGSLLGLGYLEIVFLIFWAIVSWSLLGGKKPWMYLSKYIGVPYWACGYLIYKALLKEHDKDS